MTINIKRAYDQPEKSDGYRVLVDRLWPRGAKKESLELDEWFKDIAPSAELRRWFGHDPAKFDEFTDLYCEELQKSDASSDLMKRLDGHDTLTLVYAAKDKQHNHAIVLRDYLEKL